MSVLGVGSPGSADGQRFFSEHDENAYGTVVALKKEGSWGFKSNSLVLLVPLVCPAGTGRSRSSLNSSLMEQMGCVEPPKSVTAKVD